MISVQAVLILVTGLKVNRFFVKCKMDYGLNELESIVIEELPYSLFLGLIMKNYGCLTIADDWVFLVKNFGSLVTW